MKIAIIDSGLPSGYSTENAYRIIVDKDFKVYLSKKNVIDEEGHGTLVRKILESYLHMDDEVVSLKILNKDLKGNSIALIAAVKFCIENKVDIINISLGTLNEQYRDELHASVKKAVKKGIVVVASEHNKGFPSYPANFKEVIGVRKLKPSVSLKNISYDENKNFFNLRVKKMSSFKRFWNLKRLYPINETSFLAPYITGVICKNLRETNYKVQKESIKLKVIEELKLNLKV